MGIHVLAWAGRDAPPAMRWYIELDLLARILVPSFISFNWCSVGLVGGPHRPTSRRFFEKTVRQDWSSVAGLGHGVDGRLEVYSTRSLR